LTISIVTTLVAVLGDFNAVTGTDRTGFENIIGNYGSGVMNDNSSRLLTTWTSQCLVHGSNVRAFTVTPGFRMMGI